MSSRIAEITCRISRPRTLATWAFDRIFDRLLDWRFGIDSSGRISLTSLRLDAADRAGYQPISYLDFPVLMRHIEPQGIFVDFGSGAGRCVCLASRYAFDEVVGVELSEELCATARRNVKAVGVRARIECSDAATFAIPPGATILSFINPFRGEIMRAVLANIRRSVEKYPRRITLIAYGSPVDFDFFEQFEKADKFRLVRRLELPTGCVGVIVENIQSATATAGPST